MFSDYLDVIEAARFLRVHPETVKRLIRQGDLHAHKFANKWLIQRSYLAEFATNYLPNRGRPPKKE